MFVAGTRPNQFLWCQRCCAYSGQRVQLLDQPCRGMKPRTQPFTRLDASLHPITGTPLSTRRRRMTVRDAGLTQGWDLCGSPEDTRNLYASTFGHHCKGATTFGHHCTRDDMACSHLDELIYDGSYHVPDPSSSSTNVAMFELTSDVDEDPFGHGVGLE